MSQCASAKLTVLGVGRLYVGAFVGDSKNGR